MADKEYRSFPGQIRKLEAKNGYLLDVQVAILNDTVTANKWRFTDMEGHKDIFKGVPLLVAYVANKVGDGHNSTKKRDSKGREYLSYMGATDERIIGSMSDDPKDFWTETDEAGVTWIWGKGTIWKWYSREAVEKIEQDTANGRPMSISIEALVEKYRMEGDVEIEEAYSALGITLLGDGVRPAVAGAHIATLSEIESEFHELKLRAASYINPESVGDKEKPQETGEVNNKPQKKSKDKESTTLKAFSKKQLAQLSARFEGYTVLAAGQDDNGIHVCLMSADGGTAVYNMGNLDETIAPEKIVRVNAQVSFDVGEDESIHVDCCELTDELSANIVKANSRIDTLTNDLGVATKTIEEMRSAEAKRRVMAAKDKAKMTLARFNANREEKVDSVVLNSINEAIENGEYSECLGKDGLWNGEARVESAVLAVCAAKQMELDEAKAAKQKSVHIWDVYGKRDNSANSQLDYILNEYGKH